MAADPFLDEDSRVLTPEAFDFVLNNEHPALSDLKVRQALLEATDRQAFIDDVYLGQAVLATTLDLEEPPHLVIEQARIRGDDVRRPSVPRRGQQRDRVRGSVGRRQDAFPYQGAHGRPGAAAHVVEEVVDDWPKPLR